MPRYALVDNATLTAAQRLLGDIRVRNLYNIDGDIAAFENLVQAALFYDGIYCVDDYKDEFREARNKRFEFIGFLPKEDIGYSSFAEAATRATEDIMFAVRGHELAQSDFRSFFQLLQAHLVFNWRLQTSVFYLSVSLLADQSGVSVEKYGKLQAMMMSQLWGESSQSDPKPQFSVRDSHGKPLDAYFVRDKEYRIGDDIRTFAAALNWLSLRTAFYALTAEALGMDVILHPIRHAFLANHVRRMYSIPLPLYEAILKILRDGITGAIREIKMASDPQIAELKLPMFSAYLARRTKKPSEFLTECQHLRQEGIFVEARKHLETLQDLKEEGNQALYVTEINKLKRSLSGVGQRLLARYGVSSRQGVPLAPFANLAFQGKSGLSLPDRAARIAIPRSLTGMTDRWGFRGVFRSTVEDLVSIERLGDIHDIITAAVRRDKGASRSSVHEEKTPWLGRNAWFKRYL